MIDIMDEKVNDEDVLVIIGRTDFTLETIDQLIDEYRTYRHDWAPYDVEKLKETLESLYCRGKIHQPRQFGSHPRGVSYGNHWVRVTPEPHELSLSAKKAYDHYLLLAGLTS
jgi:hypothetical protein